MQRLRSVGTVSQLLTVAPVELRQCGFRRAWISRLEQSALRLGADTTGAFVPLTPGSHEAEMIRRRTAILVADGAADPRVEPLIAAELVPRSYVAAPILIDARVIGCLHADGGRDRTMTGADRDVIALFAEMLGQVLQRIVLQERFEVVRRDVRRMADGMASAVEVSCSSAIALDSQPPARSAPAAGEGRLADLLTSRELEVLRLMARGETNGGIAAALVISESTVKSHVKHVLRKMHVANRAQAVARYLRMVHNGAERAA
ncbi:MAG: hypothetical protein QOF76_5039 [Solirubrobacteraceae bacterium]|jgi:DNA-binding CsgD family transcriptional regulator|nr:hypothetical protein [Solirubrobacteraceae bacterium]